MKTKRAVQRDGQQEWVKIRVDADVLDRLRQVRLAGETQVDTLRRLLRMPVGRHDAVLAFLDRQQQKLREEMRTSRKRR